ncbi:MAG: FG-GAP-like repeat-containing protein [Caldilineaceae bacterium]
MVDADAQKAKRTDIADLDGDGDLDLIAANNDTDEIAWYQNDGAQNFTKKIISTAADGAYYVSMPM